MEETNQAGTKTPKTKKPTLEHEEAPRKELEELRNINSELKKDYDELKDMLQRNHAEFQNYIRRVEDEKKRFVLLANENLIQELLVVLDNFDIALEHNKAEDEFTNGMKLIHEQLKNLLIAEGIEPINTTGKFNPAEQEALLTEETSSEPNIIIEELRKGYKLNGKVLRTAKVKISKRISEEKSKEKQNGGKTNGKQQ